MNNSPISQNPINFSLVRGGLVFRIFQRAHLSGEDLELGHRRVIVITMIAWLPLLVLTFLDGHLLGGVTLPFLYDIEYQVRFLVAVPMLIAAEVIVHSRLRAAIQNFVSRDIVVAEDVPKLQAAIDSATRLRDSAVLEIGLVVFVLSVGRWLWQSQIAMGTSSWYETPVNGHSHFTLAGDWLAFVSIPIFQFLLLRWYLRLLIWFRFLWQLSRLNLHLVPTHPDRGGGMSFLGRSSYAFGPILFAQGAVIAGMIAGRVLYGGEKLVTFRLEAIGIVCFFLLFILGPLLVFTPQLVRAKLKGLAEYGGLASRYVGGFEKKWILGRPLPPEGLLGTSDIQSLADLGNSYAFIVQMRPVPFGLKEMARLATATALPLVPLALTVFSLEELLLRLVRMVF